MKRDILTEVLCEKEYNLKSAAELLLKKYPTQKFFSFYGEMGAGKTTLIKMICELLHVTDVVNSPTFSIINVYKTKNFKEIFHFDLYRLKTVEEVYDIGYEDYFYSDSYCFVEWAEKIENLLPDSNVKVFIDVDQKRGARIVKF
jgi:tRNA threonylcarbamoyladenosine biosynthesis protein TsaE